MWYKVLLPSSERIMNVRDFFHMFYRTFPGSVDRLRKSPEMNDIKKERAEECLSALKAKMDEVIEQNLTYRDNQNNLPRDNKEAQERLTVLKEFRAKLNRVQIPVLLTRGEEIPTV
jgi:hypothetical protein